MSFVRRGITFVRIVNGDDVAEVSEGSLPYWEAKGWVLLPDDEDPPVVIDPILDPDIAALLAAAGSETQAAVIALIEANGGGIDVFAVADQVAMLALDAHEGDVAIRADEAGKAYMLSSDSPALFADWKPLGAGAGGDTSGLVPETRTVNGHPLSTDVTLTAGDVGAATTAQGATADSAVQPAELAAYAPVVHTHPSGQITDFTEAVQDAVAAVLAAGTGVTINYDDAGNVLTVTATGGAGTWDGELTRDTIGAALAGVGLIAVTVNDAGDSITISTTATANDTDANLRDRSTHTGEQAMSTITGLAAALAAKADDGDVTALDGRLVTAEGTLAGLGTASTSDATDFATAAQGVLAASATQPSDLATVATTGDYGDLTNQPDADDIDDMSTTNRFVTSADLAKLDSLSGTNTGDQDLSGLAESIAERTLNPSRYDATNLRAFRAAMAKRNSTPVDILAVGASWEAGSGVAAPPTNRWLNQLMWRMRNAANPGNVPGGVGYRESYSFTAGWVTPFTYSGAAGVDYAAAATSGPGRKNVVLQTVNSTVTFVSPGSGVTVYYSTGPSRGTWTWKVGAGAETTVDADAVSVGDDSVTFATTPGSTVTLKVTEASGLSFQGVYLHNLDETKGIRVFGGGTSGYRTTDFIDGTEVAYGYVSEIQPDLIVFGSMWGNDYIGGSADTPISAAQSRTNTETLLSEYRSRCTVPPSVVFVIPPQVNDPDVTPAPVDTWAAFRAMLIDLAHDDGNITVIDAAELFGASLVGTDTYGITSGDQIHLNEAGAEALAAFVCEHLIGYSSSTPRTVSVPADTDYTDLPDGTLFVEYTP